MEGLEKKIQDNAWVQTQVNSQKGTWKRDAMLALAKRGSISFLWKKNLNKRG